MSTLGSAADFEVSMSEVEAHFYTLKDRIEYLERESARTRTLCETAYGIWSRNQGPESEAAGRMADILNEILQGSTPEGFTDGTVLLAADEAIPERKAALDQARYALEGKPWKPIVALTAADIEYVMEPLGLCRTGEQP